MKRIIQLFAIISVIASCTNESIKFSDYPILIDSQADTVVINNDRDTVLIGSKGTKIRINKKTFDTENIKLVIHEFYDKSDFIKLGLTTTSGDKTLKSKGMIRIEAFDGMKKIENISKPIEIQFPTNPDDRYEIFYGKTNSQYIDWERDTLTSNYNIILNNVFDGKPCGNCDYANDTVFFDTLSWDKNYTQYDTIITFSESDDTLSWREFWGTETQFPDYWQNRFFRSNNLNWINIDAFISNDSPVELRVRTDKSDVRYYYIVFESRNSITPGYMTSKGIVDFGKLPDNEIISFICLDKLDGEIYFDYRKNIRISKDLDFTYKPQVTDLQEIRKVFKE